MRSIEHAAFAALNEIGSEIRWWHETYATSLRERLEVAGVTGNALEQIELVWERVIATQQNVLLRLRGVPIQGGRPASLRQYPPTTGALTNAAPTPQQLSTLTRRERRELIRACEACIADCDWALRALSTPLGPTDYWLGVDGPTYALSRFRDWFESTKRAARPAPRSGGRSDGRELRQERH